MGTASRDSSEERALDLELANGVHLRSFHEADIAPLAEHANDRDIWLQVRDAFPHPYTKAHARAWIMADPDRDGQIACAIAQGGDLVGTIGLKPQSDVYVHTAELGYWLGKPFWGRGIATIAVHGFTEYAFREWGYVRIFAHVFETNPGSARVLEKAGFALEGRQQAAVFKDGRFLDQFLYAKVRKPDER